jgi:hypothetical protein
MRENASWVILRGSSGIPDARQTHGKAESDYQAHQASVPADSLPFQVVHDFQARYNQPPKYETQDSCREPPDGIHSIKAQD